MQNLDHLGCYLVSRSLGRTTQTSGCAGHLLTIPDVLQQVIFFVAQVTTVLGPEVSWPLSHTIRGILYEPDMKNPSGLF